MSSEIMAYEKALHDYYAAQPELKALIDTVTQAADALRADPLAFDVSAWPSPEKIEAVLAKARSVRQGLRDTWAAVPAGMRSSIEPPPEKAIR